MRSTAVMLFIFLGLVGLRSAHSADGASSCSAPTIEVNGTGEVVVDPDRATLTLAVETEGKSSAEAAADNAQLTAGVTNALVAAGAARSDVVTGNYSVQPQWQYATNAPPTRLGYEARNTLRISVDQLAHLGKWIDAALGAGAARVENIEFDSEEAPSARGQALTQAVANARTDAETLAKAAGGHLGALEQLSTVPSTGPRFGLPAPLAVAAAARPGEETHIEPSPLHISAVVTTRWRFEP